MLPSSIRKLACTTHRKSGSSETRQRVSVGNARNVTHTRLFSAGFGSSAPKRRNLQWFSNFFQQNEQPTALKVRATQDVHGTTLIDDYRWMEKLDAPETQKYIHEETKYTKRNMERTAATAEKLYREMKSRTLTDEETVPELIEGYYYYTRQAKGSDFHLYCRKKGSLEAPEQVILDGNELASHSAYLNIATIKVTKNHQRMAYIIDTTAEEKYEARFVDLSTGQEWPNEVLQNVVSVEWAPDGSSILYTVADDKRRPFRVLRHVIGTPTSSDKLLFEELDDRFFVDIVRTKDWRYITVNINSKTTSEIFLIDPLDATMKMKKIVSKKVGSEFFIDHSQGSFYIVTNDGGVPNYQMFRVPSALIEERSEWQLLVPARENVTIDDVDVFREHVVLYERHQGLPKVRVIDLRSTESHFISLPFPISHIEPGTNLDFNSKTLRFSWSSPIHPPCIFDYDVESKKLITLKQTQLRGGKYDPDQFTVERAEVESHDGVKVPMTLIHRKTVKRDKSNPTLLQGYGAYGHQTECSFKPELIPMLERGWVIALAHVRGGGELGKRWYESGKQLKKWNSFHDFKACADKLVELGYTAPSLLSAKASSAGGLLLGVMANEYPKQFGALIMKVPFVDVLTSMLDESLPLTVHEYDEWGNPQTKEVFEYLKTYDPYFNIKKQAYPAILITASTLDIRVPYWQILKFAAKLRAHKTDSNVMMVKLDTDVGHFGEGGRFGRSKEAANEFAFLLSAINRDA